jgi:hypothetical protein
MAPGGLHHRASGFTAWGPGEYEFPDDERFAGFLQGHIERGTCVVIDLAEVEEPEVPEVPEPVQAPKPRGRR